MVDELMRQSKIPPEPPKTPALSALKGVGLKQPESCSPQRQMGLSVWKKLC